MPGLIMMEIKGLWSCSTRQSVTPPTEARGLSYGDTLIVKPSQTGLTYCSHVTGGDWFG